MSCSNNVFDYLKTRNITPNSQQIEQIKLCCDQGFSWYVCAARIEHAVFVSEMIHRIEEKLGRKLTNEELNDALKLIKTAQPSTSDVAEKLRALKSPKKAVANHSP